MMSTPTSLTHNLSTAEKFNGWPIGSHTHAHITPADVTISETGKCDNNRIDQEGQVATSLLSQSETSQVLQRYVH
jgi:hypothetical protein